MTEPNAAEVDDRAERRRTRRIAEAKFPRLKRLSEFNIDAVPSIQPAQLATLAGGGYIQAVNPSWPWAIPAPGKPVPRQVVGRTFWV